MSLMVSSSSCSSTSLVPGFRFHPTDEELVRYYLRRKVCGKPLRFDAISDIDVYKLEPWDLPAKSRLKTRDMEWYFFSVLDKKYGNSSRTNRATDRGFWKTTGKDRAVYHKSQVVGVKKTLVYHCGRAPKGERTNWVMHEYKLNDGELEKAGIVQDAFVLCRVFQKSGSGPKNGEQYGAPLIEEEWEHDGLKMFPKAGHVEEVGVGDNVDSDGHDLEQILGTGIPSVQASIPSDLNCGSDWTFVEDSTDLTNDSQDLVVDVGQKDCVTEQPDSQKLDEMPIQYAVETRPVKHDKLSNSSKISEELDFLLDESFWDAPENLQFGDGTFLETNDLLTPFLAATFSFDGRTKDHPTFHDANDNNLNYVDFDPSKMVDRVDLPSCIAFPSTKIVGNIPPLEASFPLDFYCGSDGTFVEDSTDLTNSSQNLVVDVGENHFVTGQPDSHNSYEMPIRYDMETRQVKHDNYSESSKTSGEPDFVFDESFWDAAENLQFSNGKYLDTDDLLTPILADTFDFDDRIEEYPTVHDANNNNLNYVAFDPSKMVESVDLPSGEAFFSTKDTSEGTQQAITSCEQHIGQNAASSSKQEPVKFASVCQHPFIKKASQMLGSIPASPSFAAELPTKDAALHLNSISQSSRPVHVTAGVIQIRKSPVGGNRTDCSLRKHGGYNVSLSFGLSHGGFNSSKLESRVSILPAKSVAALFRGWFYFIFFWFLVLSLSFKIGTLICAR